MPNPLEFAASLEASGDHRSDFNVVVIFETGVAGNKRPVADHKVGFAVQLQMVE
jgi:hypothetical protein